MSRKSEISLGPDPNKHQRVRLGSPVIAMGFASAATEPCMSAGELSPFEWSRSGTFALRAMYAHTTSACRVGARVSEAL